MIHIEYDTYQNYILLVTIKDAIDSSDGCFCHSILVANKIMDAVRACGPFKNLAISEIKRVANEHDSHVDDDTAAKVFDIIMSKDDINYLE